MYQILVLQKIKKKKKRGGGTPLIFEELHYSREEFFKLINFDLMFYIPKAS